MEIILIWSLAIVFLFIFSGDSKKSIEEKYWTKERIKEYQINKWYSENILGRPY